MRLHWERASRVPRAPVWAVLLVGLWLLLVLGGVLLEQRGAPALETCLLHRLTGHPCPTCGSTRVVLSLGRGAWLDALRFNPLMALGLPMGGLWLGIRMISGFRLKLDLAQAERRTVLMLGLVVLLANWIWVWKTQG